MVGFSKFTSVLGLVAGAMTMPQEPAASSAVMKRGFDCGNPVRGLDQRGCQRMSNIGIHSQGENPWGNNGNIWIGSDGPNRFTFTNRSNQPLVLVLWWMRNERDYDSQFVAAHQPTITYSLNPGASFDVSLRHGVSGAWSALYGDQTTLTPWGMIANTFGEFTTGGDFATFDVSRLVEMNGNRMEIQTNGCVSNMDVCVYLCKQGTTCGNKGEARLQNCNAGSQPGAHSDSPENNPNGGCFIRDNHLQVNL